MSRAVYGRSHAESHRRTRWIHALVKSQFVREQQLLHCSIDMHAAAAWSHDEQNCVRERSRMIALGSTVHRQHSGSMPAHEVLMRWFLHVRVGLSWVNEHGMMVLINIST
jgi:hypothetical protein